MVPGWSGRLQGWLWRPLFLSAWISTLFFFFFFFIFCDFVSDTHHRHHLLLLPFVSCIIILFLLYMMAILSGWRKAYQALHVCVSPHSPSSGGDGSFFPEDETHTISHDLSNSGDGINSSTISSPACSISNTSIPANLLSPRFAPKVFSIRASKSSLRVRKIFAFFLFFSLSAIWRFAVF